MTGFEFTREDKNFGYLLEEFMRYVLVNCEVKDNIWKIEQEPEQTWQIKDNTNNIIYELSRKEIIIPHG